MPTHSRSRNFTIGSVSVLAGKDFLLGKRKSGNKSESALIDIMCKKKKKKINFTPIDTQGNAKFREFERKLDDCEFDLKRAQRDIKQLIAMTNNATIIDKKVDAPILYLL